FHHAAQRVTGFLALVDERHDPAFGAGVRDAHRRLLRTRRDLLRVQLAVIGADAADLAHPAVDADTERCEQALRQPAHRHPRRGLARARALEDVAYVVVVVLEGPGEIGVTGPRAGHRQALVTVLGSG